MCATQVPFEEEQVQIMMLFTVGNSVLGTYLSELLSNLLDSVLCDVLEQLGVVLKPHVQIL